MPSNMIAAAPAFAEPPPYFEEVIGRARTLAALSEATERVSQYAAGIERAHLLGNSMGAQVIADFAVHQPHRAASLVLVGPTVDRSARTRTQQLWRLANDAYRERPSLIPLHLRDIVRAGWRFFSPSGSSLGPMRRNIWADYIRARCAGGNAGHGRRGRGLRRPAASRTTATSG